jgi:hypothetical protein
MKNTNLIFVMCVTIFIAFTLCFLPIAMGLYLGFQKHWFVIPALILNFLLQSFVAYNFLRITLRQLKK